MKSPGRERSRTRRGGGWGAEIDNTSATKPMNKRFTKTISTPIRDEKTHLAIRPHIQVSLDCRKVIRIIIRPYVKTQDEQRERLKIARNQITLQKSEIKIPRVRRTLDGLLPILPP